MSEVPRPAARILLGWFGKNPPYSWCLLFIILRPQATAAPCSLAIKPQLSFLFSELSLTSRPCCDCLGTSFNSPEYTWQNNFKKIIHTSQFYRCYFFFLEHPFQPSLLGCLPIFLDCAQISSPPNFPLSRHRTLPALIVQTLLALIRFYFHC